MVRKLTLVGFAVLAMLTAFVGDARGQSGVTVDPDSAAGKEYSIPVDRARKDAGVDTGTSPSTTTDDQTQLFGQGVTPTSGSGGSTPEAEGAGSGSGKSKQHGRDAPKGTSTSSQKSRTVDSGAPSAFSTPAPSSDALPWLLGGGALVVLAALGGTLVARRGRQTPA